MSTVAVRHPRARPWLAFALLAAWPAAALAQTPPQIEKVRIGLPAGKAGQEAGRSRNGAWAPVYVTLKAGGDGNPQGAYTLAVETADSEDDLYRYTVPVPAISAGDERVVIAYTLPSLDGSEFAVKLEAVGGKRALQVLPRVTRDPTQGEVVGPNDALFLAAGSGLSLLRKAGEELDRPAAKPAGEEDPAKGRRQFAYADTVASLPDRWWGYAAADVVVLATGSDTFVNDLRMDRRRQDALLEWARRGGTVVLSVGRNQQGVDRLLAEMPLIDVKLTGKDTLPSLPALSPWSDRDAHLPPLQNVEAVTLKPGPGVDVLVREGSRPVVLQGACGLGRVVLVAFDLDTTPFTTWEGRLAFWQRLQGEVGPPLRPRPRAAAGWAADAGEEMRITLQKGLETFEEIPTISFGWVALFILFYIALVGPLDYFVLKKLFKRLELTWVTFPVTVLVVSALAYFTAYALKGDEVRINKIDIVEINLGGTKQVYGHTWFTLFSPRVQNYTLGIEPSTPDWAGAPRSDGPGPVLAALEGSNRPLRPPSQGLFPRPYDYAEDAAGIERVPVPVWATRAFAASWRAPLRPGAPAVEVRDIQDRPGALSRSRGGDALVGRVTNHLPVELQGVALFYREKWYDLGTLAAGESFRVEPLFGRDVRGQGQDLLSWFGDRALAPDAAVSPSGRPLDRRFLAERSAYRILKPLLFHAAAGNVELGNSGLRPFDQSWRLKPVPGYPDPNRSTYRDEAILVARTPMISDKAEAVTTHGASPSRLWVGALPGAGGGRPEVPGYLVQETYLRVYIPVKAGEPAKGKP